jgi:small subunit ribosomal protein S20
MVGIAHATGMPHTNSAKKRLRQSLERRTLNRAVKSAIKTQVRKVRAAVTAGDLAKAQTELQLTAKKLDRAGAKRVIHPNAAARTKSRLAHLIRAAKTKATAKA